MGGVIVTELTSKRACYSAAHLCRVAAASPSALKAELQWSPSHHALPFGKGGDPKGLTRNEDSVTELLYELQGSGVQQHRRRLPVGAWPLLPDAWR